VSRGGRDAECLAAGGSIERSCVIVGFLHEEPIDAGNRCEWDTQSASWWRQPEEIASMQATRDSTSIAIRRQWPILQTNCALSQIHIFYETLRMAHKSAISKVFIIYSRSVHNKIMYILFLRQFYGKSLIAISVKSSFYFYFHIIKIFK